MSYSEPFFAIPASERRYYLIGRLFIFISFLSLILFFALRIIFPTLPFAFDFHTPQSTKNTFLEPRRASDQSPITNGKIDAREALIGNFDGQGTFSRIRISFDLDKKSGGAMNPKATVSRSYRSFFLPIDDIPLSSFEHPPLYRDKDNIYYMQDGDTLRRFVSARAYFSRYPESFALPLSSIADNNLPVSEDWVGFRVGSLLSFGDGVFLVTGEHEVRPFGDPEIFLSMGYRFDDVTPVNEEEIGIYKRGRILLYGAAQPDGTVFQDIDSGVYLIVENRKLRPITSPEYRKFLSERTAPIEVSLSSRNTSLSCTLSSSWLDKKHYTCDIPERDLSPRFGSAFQITITSGSSIDIGALNISLITDRTHANFLLFASQMKSRILNRFGIGQ